MQSLQVVAPPGSILIGDQFLEKVSWPGTLPSLEREGGGVPVLRYLSRYRMHLLRPPFLSHSFFKQGRHR